MIVFMFAKSLICTVQERQRLWSNDFGKEIGLIMATKIERIHREIAKTREKIAEYQEKLKTLEAQIGRAHV